MSSEPPATSSESPAPNPRPRRRRNSFPGEQVAVTVALLIVFGFAWRYGDTSRRANRVASLEAATREAATKAATGPVSATGPGYGNREVAARSFEDLREITNSIGMTMREVPRTLGLVGNANDPDGDAPERVVKTHPFFIGTAEVTRLQWKRIVGPFSDPSIYNGEAANNDALPVNNVDFPDAIRFCKLLSAREGRNYRLPTEYEWEIACWGRRTGSIFGTRAAMKIADLVATDAFETADAATRVAMIRKVATEVEAAASDDLIRLGISAAEISAGFHTTPVWAAANEVLFALEKAPAQQTRSDRRALVYDTVLPAQLKELQRSNYAGGSIAGAARFTSSNGQDWVDYGKYQATWWKSRATTQPQEHPFGLQDMLGGMMEWTTTPTMPYPSDMVMSEATVSAVNSIAFEESSIPFSRWATLEELPRFAFNRTLRNTTFYIVRGGSFERAVESCTPWNRYAQLPLRTRFTAHRESLGFRVALEP